MDAVQAVALVCRAFRLDLDPSTLAVHAAPLREIDGGELAKAVDRVLRLEASVTNPTAALFAAVTAVRREAALDFDPLATLPPVEERSRLRPEQVADIVERLRKRASAASGSLMGASAGPGRPTTPTDGRNRL